MSELILQVNHLSKTFGTHEVPIRLHREVTAKLDVHVREA